MGNRSTRRAESKDPLAIARARVGTVLRERWTLDRLIAMGGMAAVYAATHRNGSHVAIKIMHPELLDAPTVKERFLREGYVGNAVDHPGVPRVVDDDVLPDGTVFLVMDLLQGETLAHHTMRRGGYLAVQEVLAITDRILDVLEAAHARGVIHRDIKPDNVFLTTDGGLRLLDFGIARLRETHGTQLTHAGFALGTPAFMAPEQARASWDEVDVRTDLWAVGATMFTTLTGQLVHDGASAVEELLLASTRAAPPITSVLPGLRKPVADIVDRALDFDRLKRWSSATEMRAAVIDAAGSLGAPMTGIWEKIAADVIAVEATPKHDEDAETKAGIPVDAASPKKTPTPRRDPTPPKLVTSKHSDDRSRAWNEEIDAYGPGEDTTRIARRSLFPMLVARAKTKTGTSIPPPAGGAAAAQTASAGASSARLSRTLMVIAAALVVALVIVFFATRG